MRIYLAGPLTQGDRQANCLRAVEVGHALRLKGHAVYVSHLWELVPIDTGDLPYEEWMQEDAAWIGVCDAVFRMEGYSPGSEREVSYAKFIGLSVFTDLDSVPVVVRNQYPI